MQWYRAYDGTVSDPKLAEAAMIAEVSRSVSIAAWHSILENACSVADNGRIDITARRIAIMLTEPIRDIERLLKGFEEVGIIDGQMVVNWGKRQYASDKSTDRVRRFRQKQKANEAKDVTPDETHETFHETVETVSVTDQNRAEQSRTEQNRPEQSRAEVVGLTTNNPRAAEPLVGEIVQPISDDAVSLTSELARMAGISLTSPKRMMDQTDIVAEWLGAGFEPESIRESIARTISTQNPDVRSLKYFDQVVRKDHGKRIADESGAASTRDFSRLNPGVQAGLTRLAELAARDACSPAEPANPYAAEV